MLAGLNIRFTLTICVYAMVNYYPSLCSRIILQILSQIFQQISVILKQIRYVKNYIISREIGYKSHITFVELCSYRSLNFDSDIEALFNK